MLVSGEAMKEESRMSLLSHGTVTAMVYTVGVQIITYFNISLI